MGVYPYKPLPRRPLVHWPNQVSHATPMFLRQLHLHLEEPVGGVGGRLPRRVRQVHLVKDGIREHIAVDVEATWPHDDKVRCPKFQLQQRSFIYSCL